MLASKTVAVLGFYGLQLFATVGVVNLTSDVRLGRSDFLVRLGRSRGTATVRASAVVVVLVNVRQGSVARLLLGAASGRRRRRTQSATLKFLRVAVGNYKSRR